MPTKGRARTAALVVALVLGSYLLLLPSNAQAADPCNPLINAIACENSKPGNPSTEWDVSRGGDSSIVGFATDISVNVGQTVHFKVDTDARAYTIDIYRLGYYGGDGARKIASVNPSASLPQNQPACLSDTSTGLIDCGNWAESAAWAVPATAVSGIYIAHITRTDTGGDNHIVFVVRDDSSHSDLLFQTSDSTWQAYNDWGGNSLYSGQPAGRAYKVSYNRPFNNRATNIDGRDFVFGSEYPMVRFLEANGYDVSYSTGVDTARRGGLLTNHKTFMSVGHDEYWSGPQRANVEAARSAGVNLAFFSGNEVFWKTRWEPSIDSSATSFRTMVTYKETKANAVIDPADPPTWTGSWRDPRFSPPADGGRPENALTGQLWTVQCCTSAIQVPAAYSQMRIWRNTSIASLGSGQVATLADGTLGYEWDEAVDNGSRPAGLVTMSETTENVQAKITDYGSNVAPGTATHSLTLYRASSGALVFGAGTVQWSWGLDSEHDGNASTPDVRMQQATVNVLADMGAQPGTRQPGLVAASASTDTAAPTSTITSPPAGSNLANGTTVTLSGTASDNGGGRVGAVEVSTDGGTTWHPAKGTTSWTYAWSPSGSGQVTVKTRATDDSGNSETPSAGRTFTIACPCSVFGSLSTPSVTSSNDAHATELGMKFRADVDGWVTGVRFYKGAGNTGTHTGTLWSASGQQLATATFSNETASGWQSVSFSGPVPVTAGTTYVVSYFAPAGHYAADAGWFASSDTVSPPLRALANGVDGPNGVFRYDTSGFPTSTFSSTNYWVDVTFTTTAPPDSSAPTVTAVTPVDGTSSVPVSTTATATFSEAVQPSSIAFTVKSSAGATVAGATTYDSA
ncbi:MAG TPA: N,N-dimethylformamidase beta subunit family domain-containing protein, partial [Mycobacteriales bacterium]